VKFTKLDGSVAESKFDVIVFSLGQDLAFTSDIAKKVAEIGGNTLEPAIKAKAGAKPGDVIVIPTSGSIKSKHVIAIVSDENADNFKKGIKNALAEV